MIVTKFCSFCDCEHLLTTDYWVIDKRRLGNARYSKCKSKNKTMSAMHYKQFPQKRKAAARIWYSNLTPEAKARRNKLNSEYKKKQYHSKYKFDPMFTLKVSLRSVIYKSFKRNKFIKPCSTETMIGCTFEELCKYIESMFDCQMTWNNYGKLWHIDHICPCDQVINKEELVKLQHFSNLRPYMANMNLKKSKTMTEEAVVLCRRLLGREPVYN